MVEAATAAIGARLVAVYALGSLAHGGFSPAVSDVDAALILASPPQQSDRDLVLGVADRVRAGGSALHSRISLFWATPESLRGGNGGDDRDDEGRFPPLDRLCLFEHGRLLAGTDVRGDMRPPEREELVVAGARFAVDLLAEAVIAHAGNPAGLLTGDVRLTTKLVLFPVRFLFTADTGREGTNDAAVQHYSAHHHGPTADLVGAAFGWRTGPPPAEHAAALLSDGFVPLYDDYLTDHITRLAAMGEAELADRFDRWRSRLLLTAQ